MYEAGVRVQLVTYQGYALRVPGCQTNFCLWATCHNLISFIYLSFMLGTLDLIVWNLGLLAHPKDF